MVHTFNEILFRVHHHNPPPPPPRCIYINSYFLCMPSVSDMACQTSQCQMHNMPDISVPCNIHGTCPSCKAALNTILIVHKPLSAHLKM